jgi:hypothetical protein
MTSGARAFPATTTRAILSGDFVLGEHDDARVRWIAITLGLLTTLACASTQPLRPFAQTIDIPAGAKAEGWQAPLLDLGGHERFRVALNPLSAVEGGIVAFELSLTRRTRPEHNLLGERSGYSEECHCYPEKAFVLDTAHLGTSVATSRFGVLRRFAVPSTDATLSLEVLEFIAGHGVGSCDSCPRIERLAARVSVSRE